MHTSEILIHLKKHGQLLDSDISAGTGIPLETVRASLAELSARGDISVCTMTTFKDGVPVEGIFGRASGFFPSASPGRKPGVKSPV